MNEKIVQEQQLATRERCIFRASVFAVKILVLPIFMIRSTLRAHNSRFFKLNLKKFLLKIEQHTETK